MRPWLPLPALIVLVGCGSPGDPMPPALNRPQRVADLSAIERGATILATFTLPTKTSEDLPVKGQPEIEIRVGPIDNRFIQAEWEQASDRVPESAIHVEKGRVEALIPTAKYVNRTVVVGVRVLGPKGRNLGWTVDVVNILPELPKPASFVAQDAANGVALEWTVARPAAEYRVYRKLAGATEWSVAGLSPSPRYADTTAEFGMKYEYYVQAVEKSGEKYAESEFSEVVSITPKDSFPPAAPTGVTAVPGTRSIELVWDAGRESDLAFYRVYRNNLVIAERVASPSYSDRDIVAGAKHAYQITAVDNAGNESLRSASVESTLP